MNIGRIAATTAAQVLNAFGPGSMGKLFERASRELDRLHLIGKLRQTGEAWGCVSGSECRRLRGNWNGDRLAHLASDRQNAIRFLLTVDAYRSGSRICHGSRTVLRRVPVGTLA